MFLPYVLVQYPVSTSKQSIIKWWPKIAITIKSAGMVIAPIFWNAKAILIIDHLPNDKWRILR